MRKACIIAILMAIILTLATFYITILSYQINWTVLSVDTFYKGFILPSVYTPSNNAGVQLLPETDASLSVCHHKGSDRQNLVRCTSFPWTSSILQSLLTRRLLKSMLQSLCISFGFKNPFSNPLLQVKCQQSHGVGAFPGSKAQILKSHRSISIDLNVLVVLSSFSVVIRWLWFWCCLMWILNILKKYTACFLSFWNLVSCDREQLDLICVAVIALRHFSMCLLCGSVFFYCHTNAWLICELEGASLAKYCFLS